MSYSSSRCHPAVKKILYRSDLPHFFPIAIKIENCCEGSKQNNREYKITLIRLVNELILHKLLRHLTKCRWLSSNGVFLLLSSNNNSSTLFTLTMGIRKAIEYSYFFSPQPYTFFIITQFSRLSSFKTMEFFYKLQFIVVGSKVWRFFIIVSSLGTHISLLV